MQSEHTNLDTMIQKASEKASEGRTLEQVKAAMIQGGYYAAQAGRDFDIAANKIWENEAKRLSLVIQGSIGTGKTLLARAIFPTYHLVHATALTDSAVQGNVIIDDLGTEASVSDFGVKREPFADWLLKWYAMPPADRGRFCITTNLTPEQIDVRYGDRVTSRMNAVSETLRLTGKDRRVVGMEAEPEADLTYDPGINAVVKEFRDRLKIGPWYGINFGQWIYGAYEKLGESKGRTAGLIMSDLHEANKAANPWPHEYARIPDRSWEIDKGDYLLTIWTGNRK